MQRAISLLFIFFINLFFFYPFSLAQAGSSAPKETNPRIAFLPDNPLDCILLWAEKIKDPYCRCELLNKIAGAYIELNRLDKSEQILTQALELAQQTKNETESAILFSGIIEQFITLGQLETAMSLVKNIAPSDSRNDIIIIIISGYARKGRYEKALELVKEINEPGLRALALFKIKDALAEQKFYGQMLKIQQVIDKDHFAEKFARLIARERIKTKEDSETNFFISSGPSKKSKALIALFEKQFASAGPSDAADNILREAALISEYIKSRYIKDERLAAIGIGYVKIGRYEEALALANSIKIPFSHSELLANIASAYVQIKELKKASALVKDISVEYFKEKLIAQIMIRHIEHGQEQLAAQIAGMLSNTPSRGRAYAIVADYYAGKENFYAALNICGKIEEPEIKIITLLEIAKGLQKTGNNSKELRLQLLNGLDLLK